MTAHKNHTGNVDTLMCHYCGHTVHMPERCPKCGSSYIAAFGLGTQKAEEMLHREFPAAAILRMDADTTTGKNGHEGILSGFRQGKADILIGTQMIVKGHDFPGVTLVAALAADMSMFENDYRSSERTFQLLMQASGRAGRRETPGEVVIQTYRPEHYVLRSVAAHDPGQFYENELAYRRMMDYPPCGVMLTVRVQAKQREHAEQYMAEAVHVLKQKFDSRITLVGPAPEGVFRVKDRFRLCLYVKAGTLEEAVAAKERLTQLDSGSYGVYVQYEMD